MNQNEQDKAALVIQLRNDMAVPIHAIEGMDFMSPIELMFRQSGRTTRMMDSIFDYKSTTAHSASKIYPKGLPEIVKTVIVFSSDPHAQFWKNRISEFSNPEKLNIECLSINSGEFKELWEFIKTFHTLAGSVPEIYALKVLIDHILGINSVLRAERNVEIVLDHEIYERACSEVINQYMDFSITPYRLVY